jgi:hypothetical protein
MPGSEVGPDVQRRPRGPPRGARSRARAQRARARLELLLQAREVVKVRDRLEDSLGEELCGMDLMSSVAERDVALSAVGKGVKGVGVWRLERGVGGTRHQTQPRPKWGRSRPPDGGAAVAAGGPGGRARRTQQDHAARGRSIKTGVVCCKTAAALSEPSHVSDTCRPRATAQRSSHGPAARARGTLRTT